MPTSPRWTTATTLALLLVACGDDPAPPPPATSATPPAARPTTQAAAPGGASAEEIARAARGDLRCPPAPAAQRPAGAPVDDIVGVRPGMTWDDAARHVMCSHPLMVVSPDNGNRFNIPTFGQPVRQGLHGSVAQPRVVKSGREIMQELQDNAIARGSNRARRDVAPGESRWYVGTIGLPDAERVTHVQREEWFETDLRPPVAEVEAAMVAKYGPPTRRNAHAQQIELTWVHDPAGRRVAPGASLASGCGAIPHVGGGVTLSTDCGVVVAAHVLGAPDNPGLAQAYRVGVVDQAAGYALVDATERALQQQESQRRAQQVQDAAGKAKAPTL